MIDRIEGKAAGERARVRHQPPLRGPELDGPATSRAEQFEQRHRASTSAAWEKELQLHDELFQQLAYHLPRRAERHQGADREAPGGLSRGTSDPMRKPPEGGFLA